MMWVLPTKLANEMVEASGGSLTLDDLSSMSIAAQQHCVYEYFMAHPVNHSGDSK